ncbi:high-affinity Cu transporter CTR3 [Aspergillus clavatus NRRL 1]|uniref:Copper transport protein n=1 Tax=Aspergillus clavatus (strain ATCC 1007 / CBS 513.65 / DSM 816 / NCTC 3887 / NRRL 1 / QM 1276 / 107) TaxID=344612 RepID=A1CET7_ASPCL|nr:Ctr copper transporter family protein [Aspergillus clavatus NRRL 1]EAW11386.1 Ctr copper transporter family protein [Aspergillus clavatus NRRL 1]
MDHMDHATDTVMSMATSMVMTATSTAGAAMSTAKPSGMGGMGGMGGNACKISMLWNWYTIDSCFIARSWRITSNGMFAGSCIGVICLVLCLEFLRRVGREYDAFIVRRARLRKQYLSATSSSQALNTTTDPATDSFAAAAADQGSSTHGAPAKAAAQTTCSTFEDQTPVRPTVVEQLVRALLHMLQFAIAYFVMLLAMYYNGYILICIFIGAFLGSFIFSWEPLNLQKENDATTVTKCCG